MIFCSNGCVKGHLDVAQQLEILQELHSNVFNLGIFIFIVPLLYPEIEIIDTNTKEVNKQQRSATNSKEVSNKDHELHQRSDRKKLSIKDIQRYEIGARSDGVLVEMARAECFAFTST